MRLLSIVLVLLALAGLAGFAQPARAQSRQGNSPVIITASVLGTLGGITTSVGAIVYAIDGRAFDDYWIVASLFSSAICGALTVAAATEGFSRDSSVGTSFGMLLYAGLTIWPAYWTIRTALSDVDPGEYFDGEVAPAETEDPALTLRGSSLPQLPVTHFSFGGSF